MSAMNVLAIDFGTANSYFCKCPGDQLTPNGVDFGDGRDGLATAILYRKGRSPLIGQAAMEEYYEATPQERSGYVLRTHFKPDIATGQEARRNAADFLGAVLEDARGQQLDQPRPGRMASANHLRPHRRGSARGPIVVVEADPPAIPG